MHQYVEGQYTVTVFGNGTTIREITQAPIVPVEPPEDPCKWLIDVGPFFDRFGLVKPRILRNEDPIVKGFIPDILSRHWVDLRRPDLIASIAYMRGVTIPELGTIATPIEGLTAELEGWILGTPASAGENLALRKLYFS